LKLNPVESCRSPLNFQLRICKGRPCPQNFSPLLSTSFSSSLYSLLPFLLLSSPFFTLLPLLWRGRIKVGEVFIPIPLLFPPPSQREGGGYEI